MIKLNIFTHTLVALPVKDKDRSLAYTAKQKYRGMFETQKSGNKTSSGEIGLDIRTHASPKVGQDQVSGGVSVLLACRTSCKCSMETSQNWVKSQKHLIFSRDFTWNLYGQNEEKQSVVKCIKTH